MAKLYRKSFIFAFAFFLFYTVSSTKTVAAPGWVKDAIESSKTTKLDKDASALVLLNWSKVKISEDGSSSQKIRWVLKILSVNGSGMAKVRLSLNSVSSIKGLKGWRLEKGGKGKEHNLDKNNVVDIGYNASGYYDDQTTRVAIFPDAKTGDIIAFEYTQKKKKGVEGFFNGFVLQDSLPVILARYEVIIPDHWQLHRSESNLKPFKYEVLGNHHVWEATSLAYRPSEPFMPSWKESARRIIISCHNPIDSRPTQFTDWRSCVRWANGLQHDASVSDDNLRSLVTEITDGLKSNEENFRAIAEYVRDQIRYVAVEIGQGRFIPREATTTLANQFGDCKDKATLMRAMLAESGISSQPVLALAGGKVDRDFPSPFQFNHVILSVPSSEVPGIKKINDASVDGWIYFDPTDPSTMLGRLPSVLQGSLVLPISNSNGELVELPTKLKESSLTHYIATARLLDDRTLIAQVRISQFGNSASNIIYNRRTSTIEEQITEYQNLFSESMPNPVLTDYQTNSDGDSAWVTFTLSGGNYLQKSGDLYFLKADFFHPDRETRLKKNNNRIYPIWFGSPGTVITEIGWKFPMGFSTNDKVGSIKADCAIASLVCETSMSGDTVKFHSLREYDGGTIDAADYEQARKFHRKVVEANLSKIVLTKSGAN